MFNFDKKQLLQFAGFAAVTAITIGFFLKIKKQKSSVFTDIIINRNFKYQSQLNDLDIKQIDKQNTHSLYIMATQKLPTILEKVDSRGKLTFYSLYKQITEGDADEAPDNDQVTNPVKYQAWLQQRGRLVETCQQEYIALMTRYDEQFREIVDQLVTGKIKRIKVEDSSMTSGGILAKSVPRPKAEDQTQYLKSLTQDEKDMMLTYQMIREDKNESLLIQLLEEKRLDVNTKNKEGMDPLILAIDCEFTIETLQKLIKLGCSIKNSDTQGRTALHYAVDLENIELIQFLIDNGADKNTKDHSGSSPLDEAETNEEIMEILGA
ncbi:acyl-binding protein [Stylonychia lemnae]|uniref:Acyl-binding protein n=1 Tax=Stylonychia lemnae TaxID=5949 RepID=A0A078ARY6_STYLE|nr:acyl-binding protein [Stylonychia lemnae]|eukprot:CDW85245.1 acyl-binding protein [Stylonychia lemnae]